MSVYSLCGITADCHLTRRGARSRSPMATSPRSCDLRAATILLGLHGAAASQSSTLTACESPGEEKVGDRSLDEHLRHVIETNHAKWQADLGQALDHANCRVSRMLLGPALHLSAVSCALFMSRFTLKEIALLPHSLKRMVVRFQQRASALRLMDNLPYLLHTKQREKPPSSLSPLASRATWASREERLQSSRPTRPRVRPRRLPRMNSTGNDH